MTWWAEQRKIYVVVDNPSWILPFAQNLVDQLIKRGDDAILCRSHDDIGSDGVAIYLGCVKITPPNVLARNHKNLVVHASDLPKGKGFSPLTWLTIEGVLDIPVCLIEAVDKVDAGAIIYKDFIAYEGHELLDEMQGLLGQKTVELCQRYFLEDDVPVGRAQVGEESFYARRSPKDSVLNADKSLAAQFNLLRTVDNEKYPAFFEYLGHTYKITIEKMK